MNKMKERDPHGKYLESSAHAYVATSSKQKISGSDNDLRTKNLARLRLEAESLQYAAEFLTVVTGAARDGGVSRRECAPAIARLTQSVGHINDFIAELGKSNG